MCHHRMSKGGRIGRGQIIWFVFGQSFGMHLYKKVHLCQH